MFWISPLRRQERAIRRWPLWRISCHCHIGWWWRWRALRIIFASIFILEFNLLLLFYCYRQERCGYPRILNARTLLSASARSERHDRGRDNQTWIICSAERNEYHAPPRAYNTDVELNRRCRPFGPLNEHRHDHEPCAHRAITLRNCAEARLQKPTMTTTPKQKKKLKQNHYFFLCCGGSSAFRCLSERDRRMCCRSSLVVPRSLLCALNAFGSSSFCAFACEKPHSNSFVFVFPFIKSKIITVILWLKQYSWVSVLVCASAPDCTICAPSGRETIDTMEQQEWKR